MCSIAPASGDHNSSLDELLHEEWRCAVNSRKQWCVNAAPLKLKNEDIFFTRASYFELTFPSQLSQQHLGSETQETIRTNFGGGDSSAALQFRRSLC